MGDDNMLWSEVSRASYLGFTRLQTSSKALAKENEQNRFLTLRAGLILHFNGVYREKLHFSRQVSGSLLRSHRYTNYEMGSTATCHGFTKPEKCGSQEPTSLLNAKP